MIHYDTLGHYGTLWHFRHIMAHYGTLWHFRHMAQRNVTDDANKKGDHACFKVRVQGHAR